MLSFSATSYDSSMLGYLLQKRATSAIWASDSCSNAVLSSSSISMMSKILSTPWGKEHDETCLHLETGARSYERRKHRTTFSVQRLMCSEVKKGSCLRYESLDHMAWVTICASSIAASAGLSQPLLDSTSTQAWMRRTAYVHNTSVKYTCSSPI